MTEQALDRGQTRVDLTGGHHAVLRDPRVISNGERKRMIMTLQQVENDLERGLTAAERVVALMLHSWTLPVPLPSEKPDVLDDLSIVDMDRLSKAAQEGTKLLFPNAQVSSDPASPTSPSAG